MSRLAIKLIKSRKQDIRLKESIPMLRIMAAQYSFGTRPKRHWRQSCAARRAKIISQMVHSEARRTSAHARERKRYLCSSHHAKLTYARVRETAQSELSRPK